MGLLGTKIKWSLFGVVLALIGSSLGIPVDSDNSLVVSSTSVPNTDKISGKEGANAIEPQTTHIYQMQIFSQISNRFAQTTVFSRVKNYAKQSQEATFSIVLPETAFIAGFVMEIDGKNYTAYVKEKEEAKKTYEQAVASGQSAAHVAVSARNSNRFTVSVNVEPESKAAFYLHYEELLKRQNNHYEMVINLHPGQPVKDLSVKVEISESRKIVDFKVPPIRSGNEIGDEKAELDPRADIKVVDDKNVIVTFSPNLERQKQLASLLGTPVENGIAGQFVVQYDVERDPQGGEVLIQDGYFVHFFAPSELQPLPKHVVFVLDTSGSMHGQKIVQLRESMVKILQQLNEQDKFNLVEFNSNVRVIDLDDKSKSVVYPKNSPYGSFSDDEVYPPLSTIKFSPPDAATANNIEKAKAAVLDLSPTGSTDIYTALEVALYQVELARIGNSTHQPIIVFLTDGDPNVRVRSTNEIISKITEYNSGNRKSAIFTLSFGTYANKDFLQKLAAHNNGFSKHIYEAADASLQLQNFYKQISSPLLANVRFKYEPSTTSLTITEFPIHFGGSELVVAGCYESPEFIPPIIEGRGRLGWVTLKPTIKRAVSSVERLWAYLTVKQLLEKKELSDKNAVDIKNKALELALKYQFVTSVSSLVVVKPNATNAVETEAADKKVSSYPFLYDSARLPVRKNSLQSHSISYDSVDYKAMSTYYPRTDIHGMPGMPGLPGMSGRPNNGLYIAQSFIPIVTTTPSAATVNPEMQLLSSLPWLANILKNGVLDLNKGNYKLGLNETITDKVECPKTPYSGTGYCTLLHSCKHVHSQLVTKEMYEEHFCVLRNEYAGVCCPVKL